MAFREKAGKIAIYFIGAAALGAILLLFFRYLLPALAPFILSFIIALVLQKPVNFLEKKCRFPRALASVLLVLLLIGLLCFGVALLISALVRESAEFISELASGEAGYFADISALTDKIGDAVDRVIGNIFPAAEEELDTAGMMRSLLLSSVSAAATAVSRWLGHIVSAVPRAIVFFIALIFSGIYFCADYPKIRAFAESKLSGKLKKYSMHMRKEGIIAIVSCAKSYFAIFMMTFAELLLGFVIIGQKYAPMLAFIIAIVDILPVLGVGTVLLPWIGGLLIVGNTARALKIGAIYLVITIARQIAEPRIVGSATGLHPALTLICMYSGLRLVGVVGMIAFPLVAALIIRLWQAFSHENEAKNGGNI